MLTALIIALTATAFMMVAVITVLAGWFPRLAALAARGLEVLLPAEQPRRLDPRERAELIARLWVPY